MRGRPKIFDKLGDGVNLVDGYNSGEGEAEDALNVTSDGQGGWRSRKGHYLVKEDSLPAGFQGQITLFPMPRQSAGSVSQLIAYQYTRPLTPLTNGVTSLFVKGFTADSFSSTSIFSILGTGSNAYAPPQFIVAPAVSGQGPLYFMNDQSSTTPFKKQWTGSGTASDWTASAGTLPSGQFLIYANNRVMILEKDGTLTASNVGNPRDWDLTAGAWSVDMPPNGEVSTGLGVAGDYVLVFQESMCWVIFDSETGANRRLDDAPGCGSHWSITESPYGTFFLGFDRRVYRTDGQSTKNVGRKVQPLLDTVRLPDSSTQFENEAARGFFHGDSYYLRGKFGNDELTLEYNAKSDSWWIHDDFNDVVSLDGEHYVALSNGICTAFALDGNLDGGTSFTSRWRASKVAFGSPGARSRVRAVDVDGSGDAIQAGLSMDGADTALDPTSAAAANLCPDPQLEHNGILWNFTELVGAPSFTIVPLNGVDYPSPPFEGPENAAWLTATDTETLVYFQAPVTNLQQYTLSMYVYLDSLAGGATGVRLEARDGGNNLQASSSTLTTQDAWTRLSVTVTADENATWRFGVASIGAGDVVVMTTAALLEVGSSMSAYPAGARRDLGESADRRVLTPGVARTWALELQSNRPMALNSWTAWVDGRKD